MIITITRSLCIRILTTLLTIYRLIFFLAFGNGQVQKEDALVTNSIREVVTFISYRRSLSCHEVMDIGKTCAVQENTNLYT